MIAEPLHRVLEATGYLTGGDPAPGVCLGTTAQGSRRGRIFEPDASWQGPSSLTVYFKYADVDPDSVTVSNWHREIWNEGFVPLLWIISPKRIDLYNGFGRPESPNDAARHCFRTFEAIEQQLIELDQFAGRLAMETGQFWLNPETVSRRTSVDEELLSDLAALERDLVGAGLDRSRAQGLIGRSIFTQYLVDRGIVESDRLARECGATRLPDALRDQKAATRLFDWLADAFNGDMFPPTEITGRIDQQHLQRVADFLEAVDPKTGQRTFFPYLFNIIPVELISSIYEQFAHSKAGQSKPGESSPKIKTRTQAKHQGVHYTRLPVVSLVLDEVMNDISGNEMVLDLTCGSGVFLVEALRRLVERKGGRTPSRDLIRTILYRQIFGVDLADAAIRVAAFSLYLAALELDPDPRPPEALTFEKLIGRTLLVGNARDIETRAEGAPLLQSNGTRREFDIIVGNPPWTFRGREGTQERRGQGVTGTPRQPRGEGLDFVSRAVQFGHHNTRYGIVLSAMPFFSNSNAGASAARHVIGQLSSVTIVNLTSLRGWLFPTAKSPAVVLLAGQRPRNNELTIVNVPWSPMGEISHSFSIAPSDIATLQMATWTADPERLKTVVFGRGRDMRLLDDLRRRNTDLNTWLKSIGSEWRDGLIFGKPEKRTRDARGLRGLEVLGTKDLAPFLVPSALPRFTEAKAEWPRSRDIYRAPLLLIKEFLNDGPRPITAVADHDLVYTDAYFGAAVEKAHEESAHLVAAILSSAFAAWFFLVTASEFGVWKRRLLTSDVGRLPIPNPSIAVTSPAGLQLIELESEFRKSGITPAGWESLDNAVFDLCEFDDGDRIVVRDGLVRAGWQWAEGREAFAKPADTRADLEPYARAFLSALDPWLQATNKRRVRAEVFDLPVRAALRVIRFVVEEGRRPPSVRIVSAGGDLGELLYRIGRRLDVRLGADLIGERELRVHGANEVVIIKPASRRFWMQATALQDADTVVAESFVGVTR